MARCGAVVLGAARPGTARVNGIHRDSSSRHPLRSGGAWLGVVRWGKVRLGAARSGDAMRGVARLGTVR